MNKRFKLYGIIFLLVVVVLALLQLNKREMTDWSKNFDVTKKTPFGLYVFDSEVNHLLNKKVSKTDLLPYDFYDSIKIAPHNILIIESDLDMESWNTILKEVAKGSDALVLSDFYNRVVADSLGFLPGNVSIRFSNILKLTDQQFIKDSLIIEKFPEGKGFRTIKPEHQILGSFDYDGGKANFIKVKHGAGNLYLHTEPLIITNYYLLRSENQKYIQNVFSYLPNRTTIWFSNSGQEKVQDRSPMRFILSKPGLRYAWYLLLTGLLLFVIFRAKRTQRIVPVIEPLKNKSVEFVKSIGNLYLQEGDFHDMMAKKAQFFLNRVRLDLLIDTSNLDENFVNLLHLKTGQSIGKINEALSLIKKGQDPYSSVIQEDLIRMNQLLDEIWH